MGTAGRKCSVHVGKGQEMAIEVIGRLANAFAAVVATAMLWCVFLIVYRMETALTTLDWFIFPGIAIALIIVAGQGWANLYQWLWGAIRVEPDYDPEREL